MSTFEKKHIAQLLLGKTRSIVMSMLYLNPDKSLYVREIIRAAGTGSGAVQRELEILENLGLIVREASGKQVYYRAVTDHPIYPDLRGLLLKTTGVAVAVRDALRTVEDRIDIAFLYGSIARRDLTKHSDIDVMIIGSASFRDISDALYEVETNLSREVNPSVFPPTEFRQKAQSGDHFLTTVINQEKIMLIGGEDELRRLVDESVAD